MTLTYFTLTNAVFDRVPILIPQASGGYINSSAGVLYQEADVEDLLACGELTRAVVDHELPTATGVWRFGPTFHDVTSCLQDLRDRGALLAVLSPCTFVIDEVKATGLRARWAEHVLAILRPIVRPGYCTGLAMQAWLLQEAPTPESSAFVLLEAVNTRATALYSMFRNTEDAAFMSEVDAHVARYQGPG